MKFRREIEGGFTHTHDTRHDGEHIPDLDHTVRHPEDDWEGTRLYRRCQYQVRDGGLRCFRRAEDGFNACLNHLTGATEVES